MSIKSSKRDSQNQGFTPYQSEMIMEHEISQFSKLNLNSERSLDRPLRIEQSHCSSDLLSMRSRKRKASFELKSKQRMQMGSLTFLNKSLFGKSSLNRSINRRQLNQMNLNFENDEGGHFQGDNSNQHYNDHQNMEYQEDVMNKELSERSCPVNGSTAQMNKQHSLANNFYAGNHQQRQQFQYNRMPNATTSCIKERPEYAKGKFLEENKEKHRQLIIKQFVRVNQRKSSSDAEKEDKSALQSNYDQLKGRFHKTKNLLRNLSTYLHRYILYNKKAKQLTRKYFGIRYPDQDLQKNFTQFEEWVKKLSMNNFQQYQETWSMFNHKFGRLYRELSYVYYVREAYCDIQSSRLSKETKDIAFKFLHQFLEGLQKPGKFNRFK